MSTSCTRCMTPMPTDARFCGLCGTAVPSDPGVKPDVRRTVLDRPADLQRGADIGPNNELLPPVVDGPGRARTAKDRQLWWTMLCAGLASAITSLLPWSRTTSTVLFGAPQSAEHIGLATGPTAWISLGCALVAAAIAATEVGIIPAPPVTLTRPVRVVTCLSASSAVCLVVRALTLSRTSTAGWISVRYESLQFGIGLALIAVTIQMVVALGLARRQGESLKPPWRFTVAAPDPSRQPQTPIHIVVPAALLITEAAVYAISSLKLLALGSGISSLPLIGGIGSGIVEEGLVGLLLAAWLALLGVFLLGRQGWARTATLITVGVLGVYEILDLLASASGDPSLKVLRLAAHLATFLLLGSPQARSVAWQATLPARITQR